jgi:paraquat-inducible protein A
MIASAASLVSCHSCHLVCREHRLKSLETAICPRCGAPLHRRKPNSVARTWALLVAALILYFPANLLPIMTVISFGQAQTDTIISGVTHLFAGGMWPIALLIFFASIIVPISKLVILAYLLVSVQLKSQWRPLDRTRLYRITETIGRWSMVDIYVIAILIALVKLEALATVEPGPGAVFFAAVVVITMFASRTFDPRLIWDILEDTHERA